jgi:hypothetical protein
VGWGGVGWVGGCVGVGVCVGHVRSPPHPLAPRAPLREPRGFLRLFLALCGAAAVHFCVRQCVRRPQPTRSREPAAVSGPLRPRVPACLRACVPSGARAGQVNQCPRITDVGIRELAVRCPALETLHMDGLVKVVLGAGCWVLGAGCWVLGAGCWVLGAGCWVLGWSGCVPDNRKV